MINIPDNLYSVQLERTVIGGLINHPQSVIDLSEMLTESVFHTKEHKIIFSILKNMIYTGEKVEKAVLAQKILSVGIKFEIDIFDYIDSITYSQINPQGITDCVKELLKLRIRRDLWNNAATIQAYIKDSQNDPIDKIISHVDSIYNTQVGKYQSDSDPVDLYAGIETLIKKIAANPVEETGLKTPFPAWNNLFGGLISKNGLYFVSARSGEGKSCFLFNMAKGVSRINKVKTLILDTEMDMDLNMFRAAAAESQVNIWWLRTGQWTKKVELQPKVLGSFKEFDKYKGSIYYQYIPNKDIYEIESIIKRWYYKEVGRGNPAFIVYDYLKITSDLEKNRQEWQQLGDKVSRLNEIGHNLNSCIFSAGQQNREAVGQNGRNDDSITTGASDRINQYACFGAVFREKTIDEISEHGQANGTHILNPFKVSRTSGKEDYNKHRRVAVLDQQTGRVRYKKNFINYEISEFDVKEINTYEDVVKQNQLQANLKNHKHHMKDSSI